MDTMDLKGIAWVGNIYQKFEAMCLEVEETMCQETAKYVENQVQTVGASMKRFCSDVMQDLLPPSSKDLSKVASADLLLNPYLEFGIYKKPISSVKEEATDPTCIKNISVDNSNSSNDAWVDWSAASFDWEISDKEEAHCDQMAIPASTEAVECDLREEPEEKMCNMLMDASFAESSGKKEKEKEKRSRCIASSDITRTKVTDASESSGLVSHLGSMGGSDTSNQECDPDLTEEKVQESESEFEETCVLVEGNDYHPVNQKEETKQSYKKKIRGAFSLKRKSGRKQEYKQLAAQYENVNAEPSIKADNAILSICCVGQELYVYMGFRLYEC